MKRRLAAVFAADVVGYSRLMQMDETGTLKRLKALHKDLIQPQIKDRTGRIVKLIGDGLLAEFPSAVDAVECAANIQRAMPEREGDCPEEQRIVLRIGVHLGDIMIEGADIYGDGVNVAARLETIAQPGTVCISEDVHRQVKNKMTAHFQDLGEQKLKNIDGKLRVFSVGLDPVRISPKGFEVLTGERLDLPSQPSIAILPFENMSSDPDQTYFSDGITDDIITELARYRELFVIARHSSFAYRDTAVTLTQITQELGVQYILQGSVRRSGQHVRVTAQLIDPATSIHLWVERYDRDIEDIFEVQDEITGMIVNTLAGEITRDRHKRSMVKSSETVNAYDHFLRASEINWGMAPEDIRNARAEASKAIAIDKGFARAYALIAWTHISEAANAWAERPEDALEEARKFALAAVNADDLEPFGYAVLGWVYVWTGDFDRGLAEHLRAIADNPGSAHYRSLYAFTLAYTGQSEKAIEELEKAMLLNPRYPDLYHVHYGRALFNLRQYDEAIQHLERIRTSQPGNANAIALAAACYAALGRMEDANATIDEVRKASPNYTLKHARQFIPFAVEQELEHFIENLALAGLDS